MFELSHTPHSFTNTHTHPTLYKTPGKFANNKLSQSQPNMAIDEKHEFLWT